MSDKALLIIMDGYGCGKDYPGNAVTRAKTPFIKELFKKHPHTLIKADSAAVGLPPKTMGGSEVGHYTIGAGRVVWQSLERINQEMKSGAFATNKALKKAFATGKKTALHLIGMISDAGIHAHINHLLGLMETAKEKGIKNLYIHAITDGRDVREKSAKKYLKKIEKKIAELGIGEIVSISGRFYAMDRDKNWKRSKKAYEAMTQGKGHTSASPQKAIDEAYKRGDETDYYIEPIVLNKDIKITKKDAVIFFNYRTDRAKQLTQCFAEPKEIPFADNSLKPLFACFGPYSKKALIAFPEVKIKNNLGEYLSKKKKKQLRIAETEKYAHVTFFFNSQRKEPYPGEDQVLVPSSKVASYDEKPEMSADKVTSAAKRAIKKEEYDFILVNYANPDLVGHSGDFKATKKSIEYIDECLEKLVPVAEKHGYNIIITSDHGNAERMTYPDGSPCPSHTLNKVPCIVITEKFDKVTLKKRGMSLKDITGTALHLMDLKIPKEMTAESLIKH